MLGCEHHHPGDERLGHVNQRTGAVDQIHFELGMESNPAYGGRSQINEGFVGGQADVQLCVVHQFGEGKFETRIPRKFGHEDGGKPTQLRIFAFGEHFEMGQDQGVIQPGSRFQSRLPDSPLGSVIQATGGGQSFRTHGPPPPSRVQRHARIALNFPSNEGGRGFLASLLDGGVPQQLGERRGVLGPPGGDRDRNHFVAFPAGHVVSHAGVLGESCVHRAGDHA